MHADTAVDGDERGGDEILTPAQRRRRQVVAGVTTMVFGGAMTLGSGIVGGVALIAAAGWSHLDPPEAVYRRGSMLLIGVVGLAWAVGGVVAMQYGLRVVRGLTPRALAVLGAVLGGGLAVGALLSGGVAAPMFGWFAAAVSGAPIPYPRLLVTFLGPCLVWVPIPFVLVLLALLGERR